MTLQNLNKILDRYESQSGITTLPSQFELLKRLPFYCWWEQSRTAKRANHTRCCFNHVLGLPEKNGQPMPMFDYEQLLFNKLQNHKHLWIKKATGLGITEFMLRYMAWLCFQITKNSKFSNPQMCIVTGPRIELAITLIDRMKQLFYSENLVIQDTKFDSKVTVIELNGVHIEAYPSHHLDAMRGLKDVAFIYLDEADFFPPGQQQDARDVSERYIAKVESMDSNGQSTPNAPDGLFEKIEREPENTCLYKRLFLDYTYGIEKIYTREEIALAQKSPSFEREYNLKYLGKVGNVFHTLDIEAAICTQQGRTGNDGLVHK